MKQYLLSVYHPEGGIPEPEVLDKIMADVDALNTQAPACRSSLLP